MFEESERTALGKQLGNVGYMFSFELILLMLIRSYSSATVVFLANS